MSKLQIEILEAKISALTQENEELLKVQQAYLGQIDVVRALRKEVDEWKLAAGRHLDVIVEWTQKSVGQDAEIKRLNAERVSWQKNASQHYPVVCQHQQKDTLKQVCTG